MRHAFILATLLLTGNAVAQNGSVAKVPRFPEEQLTAEETKQLVKELAADPKAYRKWKREQRKKRRRNN